jgi:hypothetical protein
MHTAVLTDRERAAVQAYLRLLHTVRAALDTAAVPGGHEGAADSGGAPGTGGGAFRPALVPPSLLAEVDDALAAAGLVGNESDFFALLRAWCPPPGT